MVSPMRAAYAELEEKIDAYLTAKNVLLAGPRERSFTWSPVLSSPAKRRSSLIERRMHMQSAPPSPLSPSPGRTSLPAETKYHNLKLVMHSVSTETRGLSLSHPN